MPFYTRCVCTSDYVLVLFAYNFSEGELELGSLLDDHETDQQACVSEQSSIAMALQRAAALFVLKTSENNKLPLSAMDDLILDVRHLIDTIFDRVATKCSESLSEEGVKSLRATLHEEVMQNPFAGLDTEYQRTKYYREHLGLIVSNLLYPVVV